MPVPAHGFSRLLPSSHRQRGPQAEEMEIEIELGAVLALKNFAMLPCFGPPSGDPNFGRVHDSEANLPLNSRALSIAAVCTPSLWAIESTAVGYESPKACLPT